MSDKSFPVAADHPTFCDPVQRRLAEWNRARMSPGFPRDSDTEHHAREQDLRALEAAFLGALRAQVAERARAVPSDPDGFVAWFDELRESGPGQNDALFPWLAEEASFEALRWFFEQEAAGEAGFDDLVALTQVKMPVRAKLELARNYWDEMGRGNAKGMHGPMLDRLVEVLGVAPSIGTTVWQSLALANAMTGMAMRRDYAWHSVGALGAIELTAPDRARQVSLGLRRVGVSGKHRHYFDLHAVLDVKHSEAWNQEAIRPLVAEEPARARAIAEGALMRLHCGALCYDRYRAELWRDATAKRIDRAA